MHATKVQKRPWLLAMQITGTPDVHWDATIPAVVPLSVALALPVAMTSTSSLGVT
jgi:hypothetical protein